MISKKYCSDGFLRDLQPNIVDGETMEALRNDKAAFARALENNYREKRAENP